MSKFEEVFAKEIVDVLEKSEYGFLVRACESANEHLCMLEEKCVKLENTNDQLKIKLRRARRSEMYSAIFCTLAFPVVLGILCNANLHTDWSKIDDN